LKGFLKKLDSKENAKRKLRSKRKETENKKDVQVSINGEILPKFKNIVSIGSYLNTSDRFEKNAKKKYIDHKLGMKSSHSSAVHNSHSSKNSNTF
jgi:hypothetical protein